MTGRKAGGFGAMVKQDLVLAYRNGLVLVAVVISTVLIILVDFVFPKTAKLSATEYVVDSTPDRFVATYLQLAGKGANLLGSEDELLRCVKDDPVAVGVVFKGTREDPSVVVYRQGNEPEGAMQGLNAALALTVRYAAAVGVPGSGETPRPPQAVRMHHEQVVLRPNVTRPAFNKSLVPVILATEVVLLGYLFASVMVFQEKAEGSIRAYRVSPKGAWPYVASKLVSNAVLCVGYGAVILLFTVGPSLSVLPALGLVALAGVLLSAVGLILSGFFDDLSGFLYPAMGLVLLFGLPVTAYFFPALQVKALSWIPSYPLAFGAREILFPTGKQGFYLPLIGTLAAEAVMVGLVCVKVVERRLMREGM